MAGIDREAALEFLKRAKKGDKFKFGDATYAMVPGSFVNVAGEEDDPFVREYLNSLSRLGGGRKLYPKKQ
jgi:hypothetical protein